jgi:hypothetical protein
MNIQDELNAINEPTPGWDKDIGKGIFMGKPIAYWMELDSHAREASIEDVALENAKLRKRITTMEKRWKALRKEVRKQHEIQVSDAIQELMTEITRKIK